MQTQTLIAYLIAPHSPELSLYDVLENYCAMNKLTYDTDDNPKPESEHDKLLCALLHLSNL